MASKNVTTVKNAIISAARYVVHFVHTLSTNSIPTQNSTRLSRNDSGNANETSHGIW